MTYLRRFLTISFLTAATVFTTACGDDMVKPALTVAGAAGGALIGSKLAPNNQMLGAALGAGAGGLAGYMVGGQIGKK